MDRAKMLAGWCKAARKAMASQNHRPLAKPVMTIEQALAADKVERNKPIAATRSDQNLTGREFGKMVAWKPNMAAREFNSWVCLCVCSGKPVNVSAHLLLSGEKTDCGCVKAERIRIAAHRATLKRRQQAGYRRRMNRARKSERSEERRNRSKRARLAARRQSGS